MSIRKAYVDGPFGQIHLRSTPPVGAVPPLVALHATAYSSQSFLPLMRAAGNDRQIIALDAPGYGDSDPPPVPQDITGYADAIGAAIRQLSDERVDLLGYHTGAYMAAELAILHPEMVRRLVLIGVPYFNVLGIEEWRQKLCHDHTLAETLDQFDERWRYFVTNRDKRLTLDRAFVNFIDELKAWPDSSAAHKAMFAWDADGRLPLVTQPVLIINPQGHLAEASRVAGGLMHDCEICEMPDVEGPVLEIAAPEIARELKAWLGREVGHANRIPVGLSLAD